MYILPIFMYILPIFMYTADMQVCPVYIHVYTADIHVGYTPPISMYCIYLRISCILFYRIHVYTTGIQFM